MEPPPPPHRKSFWPLLLLQHQLWPRAPLLLLLLLLASFLCFYSLTLTTPPSLHRPPFLSSSPSPPPPSNLSTPLPSFDDHQPIGLSSLLLRSHNLTTRLDGGDDRRSSTHRRHPSKAATRDRRNGQHPNSSLPRSAGNASSYGNGTSISDVPATPPCAPPQPPQQNAGHPSNATRVVSPPPQEEKRSNVLCDLSLGRWVQDDSYPLYQPGACPFVDEGFSCRQNGRPDLDYVKWRWKPNDCDIPRLNATAMLESLRGKRLVFVGDSLSRNQWESMLCILREGLADKTRVFEIHGLRITKGRGAYVFRFPDYDCRVEFYRSHFLVDEGKTSRGNKPGRSRYTVKLDKADRSKTRWRNAHILVFNTGHWWTHTKAMKK